MIEQKHRNLRRIGLLFCFLFVALESYPQLMFTSVSPRESGVKFKNRIVESEELNVLAYEYFYNGGGVAVGDINNDGLLDLYFTANMASDKLYLNLGGLQFKDITRKSKIKGRNKWKTGVSMADVNGDGFLDIYVCYSGNSDTSERRNQLFINNGDITFTEAAASYGLDDPGYATQAAFLDYDQDGDLDMYLLNHNIKNYKDVELSHLKISYDSLAGDKLFMNNGNYFQDVSKKAGISGNPISYGLGVTVADINNDGWPDFYISNDYQENDYLYINNQDGTFSDKVHEAFRHISNFSMGNDIADINNDGLLDIMTLDMLPEDNERQKMLKDPDNYELYKASVSNGFHSQFMRNMLQLNNGDGTFSEIGQLAGVSNTDWSWAALFADFDNDGFKDLFVSNGYLRDYTNRDFLKYWGNYLVQKAAKMEETYLMELVEKMPSTQIKNYMFHNNGDLTFSNRNDAWGLSQKRLSNGAVYADLDNDGDLDIVTNNVNEAASIYRNNANELLENHFLDLILVDNSHNRQGIGARVTVFAGGGIQLGELTTVRGFQSSVTPVVHFGLGSISLIDSLHIKWPDGKLQKQYNVSVDQRMVVKKETEIPNRHESVRKARKHYFVKSSDSLLDFVHQEKAYNDFKRQPIMPFMYSRSGPALAQEDVNGDGLVDLYIGASEGQASCLMVQHPDGSFKSVNSFGFDKDKSFTDTDAAFFDANGDGHPDLYVTGGMYQNLNPGDPLLRDRLYINDGFGNYTKRNFIPTTANAKSCVLPYDYDQDGDIDLFIGGRVVPGRYPETPKSYLLQNDGKGNFEDITMDVCAEISSIGMVSDAKWEDFNGDGLKDLVLVGEWMPVTIFINEGKELINATSQFFENNYKGFWNSLVCEDIDGDGDVDLIAGNLGTNTQMKANEAEPVEMVYKDFDKNGSVDPFLCYYIQGKSYPDISRDLLLDQIYPLRQKFTSYQSYANATLKEIFSGEQLQDAGRLDVNLVESGIYENVEGKFRFKALPKEAQFSPVHSIKLIDVNNDDRRDLILFGNDSYPRLKFGRFDASYGMLFLNNGNFQFSYVPQTISGLCIQGDVKDAEIITTSGNEQILVVGVNDQPLVTYKVTPHEN